MFFILETQVENGVGAILPAHTRETQEQAEAVYYSILSVAAVSEVDLHGAIILTEDCMPVMSKSYDHRTKEE